MKLKKFLGILENQNITTQSTRIIHYNVASVIQLITHDLQIHHTNTYFVLLMFIHDTQLLLL
jgi:hypothetical protein